MIYLSENDFFKIFSWHVAVYEIMKSRDEGEETPVSKSCLVKRVSSHQEVSWR